MPTVVGIANTNEDIVGLLRIVLKKVTTTHKPHLERLVSASTGALEIIGKPHDTHDVVQAVKRELRRIGRLDPAD